MENLEYIDNYFNEIPAPEQARQFEKRLIEDAVFAEEVAFYLSAKKACKHEQAEEKKKRFAEIYQQDDAGSFARPAGKLWPYFAAAAVLCGILLGWYLFVQPPPTQKFANQYIKNNFQNLGVTMNSRPDNLQAGLRLFNEGKLVEALQRFEIIIRSDTSDFMAKKFAGIVSLRLEQYDKALMYFKQLENHTELQANPGKFYQALTYLKRDQAGDRQQAKQLLQQVVDLNLEGNESAQKWLKQL